MNPSRRLFLKSFSALAAAAVAGPTLAKLAPTDIARLYGAIADGPIEGLTFYLTQPIVIDLPNTVIRNCRFIWRGLKNHEHALILRTHSTLIESCHFDFGRERYVEGEVQAADILAEPPETSNPRHANLDMTQSIQSALNSCPSGSKVELAPGTYAVNPPIKLP